MVKNTQITARYAFFRETDADFSPKANHQTAEKIAQGSQSFISTKQACKTHASFNQTLIFKPLVAASLALSLSSVAVAQGANPAQQAATTPIITLQPGGGGGWRNRRQKCRI